MNALILKSDGQIRLTYEGLQTLLLTHLISGMDEYTPDIGTACAVVTDITGYTEWTTRDAPCVTLGWDWKMQIHTNRVLLKRVGGPRSNLMLQTTRQADLGHVTSCLLLEHYIDALDWQDDTLSHVLNRYAYRL